MVLIFKLGIAILCAIGYVILACSERVASLSNRRFHALIAILWLLTRLGLYCAIFLILKMDVKSDVANVYYPQAKQAWLGGVVYRDFDSSYAPAFPYLLALILKVWDSAKAIVLTSILIEGATLIVWLRIAQPIWPGRTYRLIAIFYTLSALVILNVVLDGQNQIWAGLLLGVAVLLYERNRPLLSSAVLGLSLVLVKFLPLLYIPAFLRWRSRPFRVAAAALILPAMVFGFLILNGVDAIQPLRQQAPLVSSGNLPYLASAVISLDGRIASPVFQMTSLIVLGSLALYFLTRRAELSGSQIVFALVILTLACALVNKKFFAVYLVMIFAPICTVAALDKRPLRAAILFGVFNLLAGLETSLWFRLLHASEHSQLWQLIPRLRQAGEQWKLLAFLGVQLSLMTFYVYYLVRAWELFQRSVRSAPELI